MQGPQAGLPPTQPPKAPCMLWLPSQLSIARPSPLTPPGTAEELPTEPQSLPGPILSPWSPWADSPVGLFPQLPCGVGRAVGTFFCPHYPPYHSDIAQPGNKVHCWARASPPAGKAGAAETAGLRVGHSPSP